MKSIRMFYYLLSVCSLVVSGYAIYHAVVTQNNLLYSLIFTSILLVVAAVGFVKIKPIWCDIGKIAAFSSFIAVFTEFNLKIMSVIKIPNNYNLILRQEAHILAKYLFWVSAVFAVLMTVTALAVRKKYTAVIPFKYARKLGLTAALVCLLYLLGITVLSAVSVVIFASAGNVDFFSVIVAAVGLVICTVISVTAVKTSSYSVVTAGVSLMALICTVAYSGTVYTIYSAFFSAWKTFEYDPGSIVKNILTVSLAVIDVLICAYAVISAIGFSNEQKSVDENLKQSI